MVLTLAIPVRKFYHLENLITDRHLDNSAKVMLASGLLVAFGYLNEIFTAWYSDEEFDAYLTLNRMLGYYAWVYWLMMACNVGVPQLLWFRNLRRNPACLFVISLLINLGMWAERFVIIVTSLHRDFLPSSWGIFRPTIWDWATLVGSLGLFFTLIFLFIRLLPMISISEVRRAATEKRP